MLPLAVWKYVSGSVNCSDIQQLVISMSKPVKISYYLVWVFCLFLFVSVFFSTTVTIFCVSTVIWPRQTVHWIVGCCNNYFPSFLFKITIFRFRLQFLLSLSDTAQKGSLLKSFSQSWIDICHLWLNHKWTARRKLDHTWYSCLHMHLCSDFSAIIDWQIGISKLRIQSLNIVKAC